MPVSESPQEGSEWFDIYGLQAAPTEDHFYLYGACIDYAPTTQLVVNGHYCFTLFFLRLRFYVYLGKSDSML